MSEGNRAGLRRSVYEAILLFGIVSLMGDIIYEGARGIVPDYLKFLPPSVRYLLDKNLRKIRFGFNRGICELCEEA